jgi:metallophosphoesterase superfamily enzyme
MKIRLISDTHVNFYSSSKPLIEKLDKYFPKNSKNELLILAGDVGQATRGANLDPKYVEMLEYFKSRWNHIILVPGNHEWYNSILTFETVNSMMRKECERLGIIYLNKNTYEYKDYIFVG